jgi:hypothetical protein
MQKKAALWSPLSATLLLLSGCIQFPTVNQDPAMNNALTYNKDMKECKESYPETSSGIHLHQRIGCMKLKGWK